MGAPRSLLEATAAAPKAASATRPQAQPAVIDWDKYRFGMDFAPRMFVATWSAEDGVWTEGQLVPYGPIQLMPCAQVLNYGQSIFEGMKAYRQPDGGIALFRPRDNARRFASSAQRLAMPAVPEDLYMRAVESVVRANAAYMGTGALMGLCPSPTYTFCVFGVPVGSRAKGGKMMGLRYKVEEQLHRAAPRGAGAAKAAGNYSPCLVAQATAREEGFHDVVYLDARTDTCLEEGSGFNVFAVTKDGTVRTPETRGSILAGITRASLLTLAAAKGYRTEEAPITVQEALQAREMFGSGTAVVVTPFSSLTYQGTTATFDAVEPGGPGPVTHELYTALTDIQYGRSHDPHGWVHRVDLETGLGAGADGEGDAEPVGDGKVAVSVLGGKAISLVAACGPPRVVGSAFADPNLAQS